MNSGRISLSRREYYKLGGAILTFSKLFYGRGERIYLPLEHPINKKRQNIFTPYFMKIIKM